MQFSLSQNLTLVYQLYLEKSGDGATLSVLDFMTYVREVCDKNQCFFLQHLFQTLKKGALEINHCFYTFENGQIYGLTRKQPGTSLPQICFVDDTNFDMVYRKYQDAELVPTEAKQSLQSMYLEITRLRQQQLCLQTQLAEFTFDLMRSDHAKFQQLKKRDKHINNLKRMTKRSLTFMPRSALPKPAKEKKWKKKLKDMTPLKGVDTSNQ